jgi:hypothetical protein
MKNPGRSGAPSSSEIFCANPKEAGEIMHKYHREIDADLAIGETRKVTELATQPNAALGAIGVTAYRCGATATSLSEG